MTGTHARALAGTSVGATAGTFDNIGAAPSEVVLNDEATRYDGFMISGAPVALTAAEAMSARVRLTSASLQLVGEIWTYGAAAGAQIATNDQGTYFPTDFIALDIPATGAERIVAAWTTYTPTVSNAWSVVVSHLHSDKDKFDPTFLYHWTGGAVPPHQGGDATNATVSATTRTSLGALTIEAGFKSIVGIRPNVTQDPVGVAGEEVVSYMELTSGISGVEPQHYPMPSIGPTLGTPVGGPIQHVPIKWLPMYITRTEKVDRSIEAFLNLSTSLGAVNGFSYSVAFSRK